MKFIKTPDATFGAEAVLARLSQELDSGKKVLWLISGGSSVASEASIINSLQQAKLTQNLTIMLMDERYGPVGHVDSNWQQLLQTNCNLENLHATAVLTQPPKSLEITAAAYSQKIAATFAAADTVIGLFGLGEDGHTAGILPGSLAAQETTQLVVSYKTPQFDRITLSRYALNQITAAYVFAFGPAKLLALTRLQHHQEAFVQLPATLLYDIAETYIYNDQVEGEAL